jgi:hypothetical protein
MKTYTKKDFHNPEKLTCQQVGEEYRLLLPEEVDGRFGNDANNGESYHKNVPQWLSSSCSYTGWTYRVPLATPLPDGTVLTSNECCWADDAVQPEPQKPKVYCAGPMRGHADWNFPSFFAASEFLEQQGYAAINPAQLDIDAGYPLERLKLLTPEEFQEFLKGAMKRDLDAIQSCDALVLLPGWEKSKGARAERAVAEWAGLRVGYLWMERGDGFRLTWGDDTPNPEWEPQSDPDGWIPHTPGDPMPCDGDALVDYRMRVKQADFPSSARYIDWGICDGISAAEIIAWRPHQPQPKQPYSSDERAEWDVDAPVTSPEYTDAPYDAIDIKFHPNDPKGAAGAKKVPMWLLPPYALQQTAWVHKLGSEKYGPYNWRENSVCASTYISAIMRHLDAWRDGEDIDPESGVTHLAHIAASCNILMDAHQCSKLIDDRSKQP